jgi:hypothetical protein
MVWNSSIWQALVFLDLLVFWFVVLGLGKVWHFWIDLLYGLDFFHWGSLGIFGLIYCQVCDSWIVQGLVFSDLLVVWFGIHCLVKRRLYKRTNS